MQRLLPNADRHADVWGRLGEVTDPELDEPLTDLGFIEHVDIDDDGLVTVTFKLPTYWCSPNFAFLMASDIRRAVTGLSWVRDVRLDLRDHMASREVNESVRLGLSFGEAFPDFETSDSIDALREKFQRKAFERRQEAVLLALRSMGLDAQALSEMTLDALRRIDLSATDAAWQKPRYLDLLLARRLAARGDDRAFVRLDGKPIEAVDLPIYMRQLRSVRINMEFNSALCRGLLDARNKSIDGGPGCAGGCSSACSASAASSAV